MQNNVSELRSGLTVAQATLVIVFSCICFGSVPFFAKHLVEMGLCSAFIALSRYLVTAFLFFRFLDIRSQYKSESFWAIASGLGVGLGWIAYVEALKNAPVASVSVIYMTYPLFTLLASWILIRNKPGARAIIASALILLASMLAFAPGNLSEAAMSSLMLAFLAPLSFGISIAILTDKLHNLSPMQRLTGFAAGAALGLFPVAISTQSMSGLVALPTMAWLLLIGLAVFTALVPQYLYSRFAPVIGPAKSAMAGSVELITMFAIGFLAFGEALGLAQISSGLLVIVAIIITPAISSNRRQTDFASEDDFSVLDDDAYADWTPPESSTQGNKPN